MFLLSDINKLVLFKESNKKDDKYNNIKNKIKGTALLGSSGVVGIQSVRSGVPRLLGVRLEQHGTSKKAAENIIKEGYLNPAYGGAEGGVTASMKLPKEFLERAKGYTFLSGKNANHPFYKERNALSSIGDVITRKIQVLGYRGSKAGKITDNDIRNAQKFIGTIVSPMTNPIIKRINKLKSMTPEQYLENYKKSEYYHEGTYDYLKERPEEIQKRIKRELKEEITELNMFEDIKKTGYKDKSRLNAIKKTQKKYKKLFESLKTEYDSKKWIKELQDRQGVENKLSKTLERKLAFENFLEDKMMNGDVKAKRLLDIGESLGKQVTNQKIAKYLGTNAAWTMKLATSPPLGAAGVGKTVYLPGTDEYFNDTNRFKYDPDDPFGNPFKWSKASKSEAHGFGGNALKTKEKVRAFGNRFSASKYLLEKEGDGNLIKGAIKLIKANPKRSLAGASILGLGGLGAYKLGEVGLGLINNKTNNREVKVKSYVRKGKLVKSFNRLNPFYNKNKS